MGEKNSIIWLVKLDFMTQKNFFCRAVYLKVAEGIEQDQIIPTFAELRYKFKLTGANSGGKVGCPWKKFPDIF